MCQHRAVSYRSGCTGSFSIRRLLQDDLRVGSVLEQVIRAGHQSTDASAAVVYVFVLLQGALFAASADGPGVQKHQTGTVGTHWNAGKSA